MSGMMPQACERCWKRKQKCDRVKPTCFQCKSSSSPCIERRLGTVLDPEDPEAHHSYIESLKLRVQKLEAQLEASSPPRPPSQQAQNKNDDSPGQSLGTGGGSSGSSETQQAPRPADHPQSESLHAEMGYLSLTAMTEFTGDQSFSNPTLSFQTFVQAATGVSGSNPFVSDSMNAAITGHLGDFHRNLLRQRTNLATIDTSEPFHRFLTVTLAMFPFMPGETLEKEYNEVTQSQHNGNENHLEAESPAKLVRVYLAVATGILLSKDNRHLESYATVLALAAYQLLPNALSISCDLEAVQCLTLLTIFSMSSAFGGSTWHLLGLAMTRCISGGMHNIRVSDPDSQDLEKRESSWAFWNLYILDAYLGTTLDRPFHLQDEDITANVGDLGESCLYVPAISIRILTGQIPSTPTDPPDEPGRLQVWNIRHAKLIHEIRDTASRGVLFHFSNYRYWRETAPINVTPEMGSWILRYHFHRSCCLIIALILQLPHATPTDRTMRMVAEHAKQEFCAFLAMLDEKSQVQGSVLTAFDGLDALSAGVGLVYVSKYLQGEAIGQRGWVQEVSGPIQTTLRLLTATAERFPSVRSLYGIFSEFVRIVDSDHGDGNAGNGWARLESRMAMAEMPISQVIYSIMKKTLTCV